VRAKRILVVDDDKIVLISCKRVLEAEGYQVVLVSNVEEALELLGRIHFDLMIMDIKMPDRDGLYLLEKIKKNWPLEKWEEFPILATSGYSTLDTINNLIERGAKDFLAKPFTPDELLSSVKKILRKGENHGKR